MVHPRPLIAMALVLLPWFAHPDALDRWTPGDVTATGAIDHSLWQSLLDRYLDAHHPSGINRFDYRAVTPEDHTRLNAYLEHLARIDPRAYPRAEQMAYWINLYNAATVRVILDHPGVTSIRDIDGSFFSPGPWDRKEVAVPGEVLSLNDIEHRILRPLFHDRRIHYTVNCASLGCPNLAARAYTGADLDARLTAAEHAYLNHPRGLELVRGTLWVSSIFRWYRVDFPPGEEALRAYWADCLDDAAVANAVRLGKGRIRYRYDWHLNEP